MSLQGDHDLKRAQASRRTLARRNCLSGAMGRDAPEGPRLTHQGEGELASIVLGSTNEDRHAQGMMAGRLRDCCKILRPHGLPGFDGPPPSG